MFGKKKTEKSENPAEKAAEKAKGDGKLPVSKGFGNTIILFIVFFIVFTVIVTGVAFFADKLDLSGEKGDKDIAELSEEKLTDPKQGENSEYVMDEKGNIGKKDVPAEEPLPETKPAVPAANGAELPIPPVNIKPQIKPEQVSKPAPAPAKPAPAPAAKPAPAKPAASPLASLTGKATTGPYVVQLASFQNREYAENEMKKLKSLIPDVHVVRSDLGEKGVWYRLRSYDGISYDEAKAKILEIEKRTKYKPYPMKK